MSIFDVDATTLFSASLSQTAQLSNLALRALNTGLEAFVAKKYDDAIAALRRAASLDPFSDTAKNAYDYMGRSYVSKGDTAKAIQTYKESLRMDPTQADIHVALANLYYTDNSYDQAVAEYEKAVNIDPSAANRYSLGQGYLAAGRYDDAQKQFNLVKKLTPNEPEADVGLGQALAKMGRNDEAIKAFQHAIDLQRDYWNAYSEMGYALAENGQFDEARNVVTTLEENNSSLATDLNQFIYEKAPPKITAAVVEDRLTPFPTTKGPGTLLTDLSPALSSPDSSATFAITFSFDKPMDRASIQDTANWTIGRSYGSSRIDTYNFGNTIPTTDISLPTKPDMVLYDETYQMATVVFSLSQNSDGTGTLDPSHVLFSFHGQDVLGIGMDENADAYSGFTGVA